MNIFGLLLSGGLFCRLWMVVDIFWVLVAGGNWWWVMVDIFWVVVRGGGWWWHSLV